MNNYELHDQAQAMADSMSGYELARALIEERQKAGSLAHSRDGWLESARHFADGQAFYRDLLHQVGRLFGGVACISDDGTLQNEVLALKVPELASHNKEQCDALAAHLERLLSAIGSYRTAIESGYSPSSVEIDDLDSSMAGVPATSLARRDALMKAVALEEVALRADPANRDWLEAMASHYRQQARDTAP